jgi:hypothetical protein
MGDGYIDDGSVNICTDNFSKKEVFIFIKILGDKFGYKLHLINVIIQILV